MGKSHYVPPPISIDHNCGFIYCAHCGGDCMHQSDVEVFRRDKEDSPTGIHAWIKGTQFVTSGSVKGNPSDRRDAVVLVFECEQCEYLTVMEIVQMKGQEIIYTQAARPSDVSKTANAA